MLLVCLLLLHSVSSGPLPEFNLQSGGRGVQREIPTFDGVDWTRSKRGGLLGKRGKCNVAFCCVKVLKAPPFDMFLKLFFTWNYY